MTVDTDKLDLAAYRRALGCFATGVTIVTVMDEAGTVHGRTVNSFTSMSMDPPLVMWAVGTYSSAYAIYSTASHYGVSILAAGQTELAMRFAGRGDQTLGPDEFTFEAGRVPVLAGGLAWLACRVSDRIVVGDHLMLVAETLTHGDRGGDGLSYFRGSFGTALDSRQQRD